MSQFKKGTKIQFAIQCDELLTLKSITTVFIILLNKSTAVKRFFLIATEKNDSIEIDEDELALTITADESSTFDLGVLDASVTIKYAQIGHDGCYDMKVIRKTSVAEIIA